MVLARVKVQGSGHRVCCSYRDVSCSRSGIFVKRLLLPLQGVQSSLVGVSENQVSGQRDPQSNREPPHPKPCYYEVSDALNPEPLNPSTGQSWPLELFSSGLAWLSPGNSAAAAALSLPMAGLMGLGLELQD